MRCNEDNQRRRARHSEIGWVLDPEHRISVQQNVAQRSATNSGETCEKQEPNNIKLRPACHKRPCEREDKYGRIVKKGKKGHVTLYQGVLGRHKQLVQLSSPRFGHHPATAQKKGQTNVAWPLVDLVQIA